MRRIPMSRDHRGAATFDLDAQRRARIAGLDEPASFAPASRRASSLPSHLEGFETFRRRDLAAMQLIEAGEAAMRAARAPDAPGLWSARAFTIASLIQAALEDALPTARARGVALVLDPASHDAPQVVGEPHRLGQVLGRLLQVAAEARGVSTIRLQQRVRRMDSRLVADITVTLERGGGGEPVDTGATDEIEIDSTLSLVLGPEILAAAIGLSTSRPPARLSATLRLRLPLARVDSAFARGRSPKDFDENALNGLRVLVVEDMDLNRDLLQMLLSPYGCQLIEAINGREALQALDADDFDVILMDLQLPQMDGFEAIRRIRSRTDARAETPILAVSGRAMAADIAMSKASGADGHLSKPYTTQDLVTAIVRCRAARGLG
ncbi:response regulator [Phenylobacterium montanum]|uniref:Response regulator n=1 Tax=Phenylobacterium montanum TaxID=2823693 RepID=A0A975G277_9CAUL|nr:response regulator [Caulobacter sp. S6]QUD89244.1 response regulator [Caulobacter sp. S6]